MSHVSIPLAVLYRKAREIFPIPLEPSQNTFAQIEALIAVCATGRKELLPSPFPANLLETLRIIINGPEPGPAAVMIVGEVPEKESVFHGPLGAEWKRLEAEILDAVGENSSAIALLNVKIGYAHGLMQAIEHVTRLMAEQPRSVIQTELEASALQLQVFVQPENINALVRRACADDELADIQRMMAPSTTRH